MEREYLSPTNDFVFKKVFGENMAVLSDFLKAVLDLPDEEYQGLMVVDPHLRRESLEDKYGVLDVKIKTKSQKSIDVEVQVRGQPAIWKRLQYYTAKMLVEQVKSGDRYDQITRAISILIADFVLVTENEAGHNRFRLYDEKTMTAYPDSIEINTLEIPKTQGLDSSKLSAWLKFFAARTEEDFMTVSQNNPAIAEAWGIIKTLSADEEARLLAESREKGRRDFLDRLDGAYREGRLEGEQKGRLEGEQKGRQKGLLEGEQKGLQKGLLEGEQKGLLTVAQKLLRNKWPLEVIAENTGLSIEEVKRLAAALADLK
jgi:predicted transposase/invertase (TIGR01784 family)